MTTTATTNLPYGIGDRVRAWDGLGDYRLGTLTDIHIGVARGRKRLRRIYLTVRDDHGRVITTEAPFVERA